LGANTRQKTSKLCGVGTSSGARNIFNEEGRFEAVLRLIEADTVAIRDRRQKIGKFIAEQIR
jgi:hypothetical protein